MTRAEAGRINPLVSATSCDETLRNVVRFLGVVEEALSMADNEDYPPSPADFALLADQARAALAFETEHLQP